LLAFQKTVSEIFVDRLVSEYAVALTMATRRPGRYELDHLEDYIAYGASPRGSINLILAARALAVLRSRRYVLPEDVRDLAKDILRHRLVLTYDALADEVTPDDILDQVIEKIPTPAVQLSRHDTA
jgi:MoxR-like ATPase